MKITKRIFIALLILTVLVSSFAFSAFADEVTEVDYSYVLEYLEEPTLFYYNFADESVDYESSLMVKRAGTLTQSIVSDSSVPGGKYLSLEIAPKTNRLTAYTDNNVYFGWSSAEAIDDFNIEMTVSGTKGTGDEQNLPRIIVAVADSEYTDPALGSTVGTTIAAIDYRSGVFSYLKKTDDGSSVTGVETKTNYAITDGVWYTVSITYDCDKDAATIRVTDLSKPSNVYVVDDAYIPYKTVKSVRVGAHGQDYGVARGSIMKFASVYGLGGLRKRNPANAQADIENALVRMNQSFGDDTVSIESKIAICEIADKIISGGFTSEKPEITQILDGLAIGVVGLYNDKLADCLEKYQSLPTFAEKQALVNETLTYVDALSEMDLSKVDSALRNDVNANINGVNSLSTELDTIERDTLAFIDAVNAARGIDLYDYPVVKSAYDSISNNNVDPTYEGAADAQRYYERLAGAESDIRVAAQTFINAIDTAGNEQLDFNTRADAYRVIIANYYDNETYPGVTEALARYDAIVEYMSFEIEKAESFIKYVNKADYAAYVSAKQENLDIAKGYMDHCNPEYAGVADAKELYAEIQEFINQQIANANAYIEAVNKLDSLSGNDYIIAIENALSLQASGNVLGVDGVTDANIKLDQALAAIELGDRYCIHFIALVATIENTASLADRYELLADAREAEKDADQSYAGVREASEKLAKAIADFNGLVDAANAEFENASGVAANTCGVGKEANAVSGHVIALIKKFFGED